MARERLKVFISYARSDQTEAYDLYKRLISDGLDAWIDKESLLPGQDWELEIRKFIRKADIVVVCLSKKFNKEGFRQKEVRLALDAALEKPEGEIFIIPVRLEKCDNLESLRRWNWVDLYENGGYENLLRALRQRANEINAAAPQVPASRDLETVQLILEGNFSEFDNTRQNDLVGVLAALLHVNKKSIRILRMYSGSIIMELELTKIGANRLLDYFERGDFRLKELGVISVRLLEVEEKVKKRISESENVSEAERGNQGIVILGNVIGSNLISGSKNIVETSVGSVSNSESKTEISMRSERLVSDRVLKGWLNLHGLTANPFGDVDLKSYPYYPEGAAWPDRWEAFLDPIPLLALCLTMDDAQALSYLLRKECLPLNNEGGDVVANRWIFPLWVSGQQADLRQSPLLTLAQSVTQTWLDFLPQNSGKLFELPLAKQNTLLELLHWSLGSANTIINLLQNNGLKEDANGLSLIRRIEKFSKESPMSSVPQDAILLSWLQLRPLYYNSTYLILPLDGFPVSVRSLWLEKINLLIPTLSVNGVVVKAISSVDLSGELPLFLTRLDWSDAQLRVSLDSQFDQAVELEADPKEPKGRKVPFVELFGARPFGYAETEERTTYKLISASSNSLARMLTLGNRLLQHHCENRKKDGVPEKYLYVEDLETILKTA